MALRAAIGQMSVHTSAAWEQGYVSASVAQLVSLRSSGAPQMPADVQAAIDAAAADTNRKSVRAKGLQLTDRLKSMARSKHRGGVHPNLRDAAADGGGAGAAQRALRGKRRQAKHQALGGLTQQAAVAVQGSDPAPGAGYWEERDVAAVVAADAAPARDSFLDAADSPSAGGAYDEGAALAYAVTRMPACYAALHRALLELSRLAPPGWRPASVLDFGAGPGTATWAAREVWPHPGGGAPLQVSAVEPSGAMSWLGHAIQQHQQLRYQDRLAAAPRRLAEAEAKGGGASGTAAEEAPPLGPPPVVRWSSRLPPRYRGPVRRHDLVVAGYVLGELRSDGERRRLVADLWRRTQSYLVLVEPGTPVGARRIREARDQVLKDARAAVAAAAAADSGEGEEGGAAAAAAAAHVVAPCPHDGACPLEGRPSWCHFVQRFQRSDLQRRAKGGAGRAAPRAYQDERFSYVVLARGPRAPAPAQVRVAGAFAPPSDLEADAEAYLAVPEGLRPRRMAPLLGGGQVTEAAARYSEGESEGRSESEDEAEDSDDDALEFEGFEQGEAEGEGEGEGEEDDEAAMERLLMESLGGDEDEEEGGDGDAAAVRQRLAELKAELAAALAEEQEEAARARAAAQEDGAGGVEPSDDELSDGGEADYGESGAEAEAATLTSSASWSRLLRPPRQRSGHVLLDVCSAVDARGRHLGGGEGVLLRQVVSKGGAARATRGPAAFKLARRVRWGDLWPLHFQQRLPAAAPPATGAGAGD
jgi:ribosomal protein RSM22 (predicted rRNA methylase)